MRVVVLHNEPSEDAAVDELDVLAQRDTLHAALRRLGHQAFCLGCSLNLDAIRRQLLERKPDVVFNLVESLAGTDRLMSLATMLLDGLTLPYTGARTGAILATSNKVAAKQRLREFGMPTPAWVAPCASRAAAIRSGAVKKFPAGGLDLPRRQDAAGRVRSAETWVRGATVDEPIRDLWILKPVWEHASFGMDDDAVMMAHDLAALEAGLGIRERRLARPHFAEQYVDGREFNLSLLAGEVLPPAEIDFSTYPPEKPRIVGRQAKWDLDSFEYQQTPRRFDFPVDDAPLLEQLTQLALSCWELFDLSGYARVDFRVDAAGRPWILEVNTNPCLSPDAGFAAALTRAGTSYDDAIQRIVDVAVGG